jgi:Flp pilus assembly protein TadG
LARRFVRQQDGSVAVEFSLVAIPFLKSTFAILETALVFSPARHSKRLSLTRPA